MAERTNKHPQRTTARGILVYPHLHAPDTKFDAKGCFQTKIRLAADKCEQDREIIEQEHAKAVQKAEEMLAAKKAEKPNDKKLQKQELKINDVPFEETEDGEFLFKVKMSWKVTPKTGKNAGKEIELRPKLYDAHLQPIKYGTKIGNLSSGRVTYSIVPYYTPTVGVKLQFEAAQIITLKTWDGPTGDAFGFSAEEDGFSAADLPAPTNAEPRGAEESDDEDVDF